MCILLQKKKKILTKTSLAIHFPIYALYDEFSVREKANFYTSVVRPQSSYHFIPLSFLKRISSKKYSLFSLSKLPLLNIKILIFF